MPSTKPATHTKKQTLPKAYCRRKIKALKLPVAQLVEQHGQRHQFRQAQRDWTPPLLLALRQQAFLPFRLERLEKVIDQAIQFRKLSIRRLLVLSVDWSTNLIVRSFEALSFALLPYPEFTLISDRDAKPRKQVLPPRP